MAGPDRREFEAFSPAADAGDSLAGWIAPSRTALLVIDTQVDFASPEGAMGRAGVDLSAIGPALAATKRLVAAARAAGVEAVFVSLQTDARSDSPAWLERMRRRGDDPDMDGALCRAGSVGAEFVEPRPIEGELVVRKRRYSAFFETDLDDALRARGLDTLVVCGLTTECCVDCTVRHAFHLDYHLFVARDATAAYDPRVHEGALRGLELNCAILVETDQVVSAWRAR